MHRSVTEDELDLISVWAAVMRRRYLVGAMLLLGLAGGAAVGLRQAPVYESRAVLQVGRVGGIGRIQPPDELVQHLGQTHGIADRTLRARPMPHLAALEEIVDGTILLTARAHAPEESRAFLTAETDKILREHQAIFDEVTKRKTRSKEALVARIAAIESQDRELGERAQAAMSRNPAVGAVLTQDRLRLTAELSELDEKLMVVELELSRISTWPTRLVREPTLPEARRGKGTMFFALAGAAAGLVLAVVAAFLLNGQPGRETQVR